MNVVQMGVEVNMILVLVVGAAGYASLAALSGSAALSQLFHLHAGLLLGVLATGWHLVNTDASSLPVAGVVAGSGALFLLQAYRGNLQIRQLLQRIQEEGVVQVDD